MELNADLMLSMIVALVLGCFVGIGLLVVPGAARHVAVLMGIGSSSDPHESAGTRPSRPGGLLPVRCPARIVSFSGQSLPPAGHAPRQRGSLRGWHPEDR